MVAALAALVPMTISQVTTADAAPIAPSVAAPSISGALVRAATSLPQESPRQPGGSASISFPPGEVSGSNTLDVPSGTGSLVVSWNASCPPYSGDSDPQSWSWYITVLGTYADGRDAFDSGSIGPLIGSTSWTSHEGFTVSMEHENDQSETITWEAQLHCGSATIDPETLGHGSFRLTRCDPDLYNQAQREFATADTFYTASSSELDQAADEIIDFRNSYLKEGAKIGTEKLTLLTILHDVYSESAAEVAEIVGVYVGVGVAIEQMALDVTPLVKDVDQLTAEARADAVRADAWAAQARADLQKALDGGACLDPIEKQLNSVLKSANLDEQAHALIGSWDNNGYLYVNPITNEVLDEVAALKAARAQLSANPPSQVRTPGVRNLTNAAPSLSQVEAGEADLAKAYADQQTADNQSASLLDVTRKVSEELSKMF